MVLEVWVGKFLKLLNQACEGCVCVLAHKFLLTTAVPPGCFCTHEILALNTKR
jgi:hypothetical protein